MTWLGANAKNQAVIRVGLASLALWSAVACGRSQGISDEQLGGLVVETDKPAPPIQVDRAAQQPQELARALAQPHRELAAALGPHVVSIVSTTQVEEGGALVSSLGERTAMELGDGGAFHAVYTNDADYGREVTFRDGALYLRPRYQRWHRRAPEAADEPAALRDQFFAPIAATWDLVAPGAELVDRGAAQVGGRAGRKIEIKLAARPAKPPPEPLAQRAWRASRVIEELSGEVILDAVKGAPLSVKLAGTVAYSRDGRRFRMKTSLTAVLSDLGKPAAITAPDATEVVATPERLREVDDRDFLLQGIAPPLRRNADGTAAPPQPEPAPAAPAPAPAPSKASTDQPPAKAGAG